LKELENIVYDFITYDSKKEKEFFPKKNKKDVNLDELMNI
jgi:hypothetical protein